MDLKNSEPFRLVRKGQTYLWPEGKPLPTINENGQVLLTYNKIGEDFVRSITGLVVLQDGEDLLVQGMRTMTLSSLPDSHLYRGRVSIGGKSHRVAVARIQVRFAERVGGWMVLKG